MSQKSGMFDRLCISNIDSNMKMHKAVTADYGTDWEDTPDLCYYS